MSREYVLNIWCDVCQDLDDIVIEAKEMPAVSIGSAKPRVLALCEEHEKTFFIPFQEALINLGTTSDLIARVDRADRPKAGRPASRPDVPGAIKASHAESIVCPVPDCAATLANTSSLRGHVRSRHATTLDRLLADGAGLYDGQGNPLAYQGRPQDEKEPTVLRAECDVRGCDVVYEFPESKRPSQALGVHRAKKHGIRSEATRAKKKAGE